MKCLKGKANSDKICSERMLKLFALTVSLHIIHEKNQSVNVIMVFQNNILTELAWFNMIKSNILLLLVFLFKKK